MLWKDILRKSIWTSIRLRVHARTHVPSIATNGDIDERKLTPPQVCLVSDRNFIESKSSCLLGDFTTHTTQLDCPRPAADILRSNHLHARRTLRRRFNSSFVTPSERHIQKATGADRRPNAQGNLTAAFMHFYIEPQRVFAINDPAFNSNVVGQNSSGFLMQQSWCEHFRRPSVCFESPCEFLCRLVGAQTL